jgi:hypothetical protein
MLLPAQLCDIAACPLIVSCLCCRQDLGRLQLQLDCPVLIRPGCKVGGALQVHAQDNCHMQNGKNWREGLLTVSKPSLLQVRAQEHAGR